MTSVRRNTYVLNGGSLFSQPDENSGMSGIDRQNLMRLKVNRIAIVQELRVEHIINQLVKAGVIVPGDLKKIETGTTPHDRTRLLIDLLATKSKSTEWYKHFRNALMAPDANANIRKRYRCLVEFLDNTIIHRPTSQGELFRDFSTLPTSKLPHYNTLPPIQNNVASMSLSSKVLKEPPNILKVQESQSEELVSPSDPVQEMVIDVRQEGPESTLYLPAVPITKGYIHHCITVPADFSSQIKEPSNFFKMLQESELPEDQQQLHDEALVLQSIRNYELMCALHKQRKLPYNIELCRCEAVDEILSKPSFFHMYIKYFRTLWTEHQVDLLADLTDSFQFVMATLQINSSMDKVSDTLKLGFKLTDFLSELHYSEGAVRTLLAILGFLNKYPKLETLMAAYKGCIKLMQLMNKEYNFKAVNSAYFRATEVIWQIDKMSFGQNLVEKGEMYLELSHMMLETGSINSAYSWAFKALQHVPPQNQVTVISVLCNAVMTYCSKWNIKRAEELAVQAVQLAREYFGNRHPVYLKALLTYCYYSNEFRQDEAGVEIAQLALQLAQTTYGTDTPQLAHAHRALCKALVVAGRFDNDDYLYHAVQAVKIAKEYFPSTHPAMYLFHFTMAFALHWRSMRVPFSEQEDVLRVALSEVNEAQSLIIDHYGDISLRHAQILGLMGQISTKLGKLDIAESSLASSERIMGLCLPLHNNYLLVAKATLAMFYSMETIQRTESAKTLMQDVIKYLESPGVEVKWVRLAFNHLVALHQTAEEEKAAQIAEAQMEEWLTNNPPFSTTITLDVLSQKPTPYNKFLAGFNIWQKRVDRLKQVL